jgi:hypothetical protein
VDHGDFSSDPFTAVGALKSTKLPKVIPIPPKNNVNEASLERNTSAAVSVDFHGASEKHSLHRYFKTRV